MLRAAARDVRDEVLRAAGDVRRAAGSAKRAGREAKRTHVGYYLVGLSLLTIVSLVLAPETSKKSLYT